MWRIERSTTIRSGGLWSGVLAVAFLLMLGSGCASSSSAEKGSSSSEKKQADGDEAKQGDEASADEKSEGSDESEESEGSTDDKKQAKEKKSTEQNEKKAKDASEESEDDETNSEEAEKSSEPSGPPASQVRPEIEEAVSDAGDGNLDRAVRKLKEYEDHGKLGYLAKYNLGRIDERRGNTGKAAEAYIAALDKNPKFAPALTNLTRMYIRNGRLEDAEEVASQYTGEYPDVLGHRVAQLEVLLAREQYREVIRRAKDVLREDEQHVGAMIAMAKANYALERYELTQWIADKASELAPEEAVLPYLLGLVQMNKEEYEEAETKLKKALELNPDFAEAHNNLGLVYQTKGNFEVGVEQYRKALEDYPGFNKAKLNLGVGLKQIGKAKKAAGNPDEAKKTFSKAEKQFKEVIESDSEYPDPYFNLGILYLDSPVPGMDKIPRLEKAIEFLNKYKEKVAGKREDASEVDSYIESARDKIESIKERRKLMRQNQQGGGN